MIRGVFDTDKLAFTELLGVPYAIRGGGLLRMGAPTCWCPGMLLKIGSFSGVYFFNESRFQKKVQTRSRTLKLNPESVLTRRNLFDSLLIHLRFIIIGLSDILEHRKREIRKQKYKLPLALVARATDYGSRGQEFDSSRARQKKWKICKLET